MGHTGREISGKSAVSTSQSLPKAQALFELHCRIPRVLETSRPPMGKIGRRTNTAAAELLKKVNVRSITNRAASFQYQNTNSRPRFKISWEGFDSLRNAFLYPLRCRHTVCREQSWLEELHKQIPCLCPRPEELSSLIKGSMQLRH